MESHESVNEVRSDREAYYEVLLNGQEESGMSVAAFAKEMGMSAATLYSWKRRLGQPRGGEGSALLEVCVRDEGKSTQLSGRMIVSLACGTRIELDADFDESALERLLGVVLRC